MFTQTPASSSTTQSEMTPPATNIIDINNEMLEKIRIFTIYMNFDRGTMRLSDQERKDLIKLATDAFLRIQLGFTSSDEMEVADADKTLIPLFNDIAAGRTPIQQLDKKSAEIIKAFCKQLGVYYTCHVRNDEDTALKYLKIAKYFTAKDTLEYAEICTLICNARTIDGGYTGDEDAQEALAVLKKILNFNALTAEQQAVLAYTYTFVALQGYRQTSLPNLPDKELRLRRVLQYAKNASDYQKILFAADNKNAASPITMEYANSIHIRGIILDLLGEHVQAQKCYFKAAQLERDNVAATGKAHFLLYITPLNHAKLLATQFNQPVEALRMLEFAYQGNISLNGTEPHKDTAKALAFLAEFGHLANKQYDQAAKRALESIQMKLATNQKRDGFIVLDTQKVLLRTLIAMLEAGEYNEDLISQALQTLVKFDWNYYQTIKPYGELAPLLAKLFDLIPAKPAAFADALYQLGAYHDHVTKDSVAANKYLDQALAIAAQNEAIVDGSTELHYLLLNHIAFAKHQELKKGFIGKTAAQQEALYLQTARMCMVVLDAYKSDDIISQTNICAFAQLILAYSKYEYSVTFAERVAENTRVLKGMVGLVATSVEEAQLDAQERERLGANIANDKLNQKTLLLESLKDIAQALKWYEEQGLLGEQYLRAKNRYADIASDYIELLTPEELVTFDINPLAIYQAIEVERNKQGIAKDNLWAGRFYVSYGNYLTQKLFIADYKDPAYYTTNIPLLQEAVRVYNLAYDIDATVNGLMNKFTLQAADKVREVEALLKVLTQARDFQSKGIGKSKNALFAATHPAVFSQAPVVESKANTLRL